MQLIYKNELGIVRLSGKHSDGFCITEISGLSLPQTHANTVNYPGVPGQTVLSLSVMARTITISGDVKDKTGTCVSKAAAVFSRPGALFIYSSNKNKKIACRCQSFIPEKRKGIYVPYVIELVCDNPLFEDVAEKKVDILTKQRLLKNSFVLPCAFSSHKTQGRVINSGTYKNEPVFEISCLTDAACPDGIVIENLTTNKKIVLNTDVLSGECITVDVKSRKITSNLRQNLLDVLSDDSVLSELYLGVGINDLLAKADNEASLINVKCKFTNTYVEAV